MPRRLAPHRRLPVPARLDVVPPADAAPPDGNRLALPRRGQSLLSAPRLPQADHAPVGRRAGRRGRRGAGDRRHARPGHVRERISGRSSNRLKAIDGRAPVSIMTNQVEPEGPAAPGVAQGGALARVPHADAPLPVLAEGRLRRGGPHLSRLRRPDEPDPRQQAGRLPDALLRLDQHRQPALLRRDLQQDQPGRELPLDRLVGLHGPHARRSRACRATWSSITTARSGSASTSRSRRSSTRSRIIPIPMSSAGCAGSSPASSPATGKDRTSTSRTAPRRSKT